MATLGSALANIHVNTDDLSKVIEQAKADFKRIHVEYTDDLKQLIADEVEKQLDARKPSMEVK